MTSSGFSYNPDVDALILAPWNITFLSQRDVNIQIPFNYGTIPGVSVTAACFTNNTYEDFAAVRCISNLLATGFKRLSFDLYWDAGRAVWTFCPVSLPLASQNGYATTVIAESAPTTIATGGLQFPAASVTQVSESAAALTRRRVAPRQFEPSTVDTSVPQLEQTSTSAVSKATVSVDLETTGSRVAAVVPTNVPTGASEIIYSIGPYMCSGTKATDILTELLPSFLEDTDNTIEAVVQFVTLNIHAAASLAEPLAPAQAPADNELPQPDDLLGQYFSNNASSFLYTPTLLGQDRTNLNHSWFNTYSSSNNPIHEYFNETYSNGILDSSNGWPSPSYQFRAGFHRRILFGFGRVDPQMSAYNFSGDAAIIFPQNYLDEYKVVESNSDGDIINGCIYVPNDTSLVAANSSWALSAASQYINAQEEDAANSDYNSSLPALSNLTACGISPFLNSSLLNTSADANILPYKHYAYSTIWSWAWNEPVVNNTDLRCAVLDPTIPGGRWRAVECSVEHYGACRSLDAPLGWTITLTRNAYKNFGSLCPNKTSFAVPRTALENRYLYEAYSASAHVENKSEPLWIDLNSKDVGSCWVTGINSTCPYDLNPDQGAQIYVPTVAGVVILVLTALLILVKCGANRAHSKRKRKGDHGWDYEGVPS